MVENTKLCPSFDNPAVHPKITYEQPITERVRMLLRYEQLMQRFTHHAEMDTPWDGHAALMTLLELFNLCARGDLKSDLMKELERQIANLSRLTSDPDVDQARLEGIIAKQRGLIDRLHGMTGQLGQHLKNNDFLGSVRQRATLPGGTCDFDLPAYHHWLGRRYAERRAQLDTWIEPFVQVQGAVDLTLGLIRESVPAQREHARRGFYEQNLDPGLPYQMIRIALPADARVFPEISAGKHRFSIRFLNLPDLDSRARQTENDVDFELRCCVL